MVRRERRNVMRRISMPTRKEWVEALRERYRSAAFGDRIKILNEFWSSHVGARNRAHFRVAWQPVGAKSFVFNHLAHQTLLAARPPFWHWHTVRSGASLALLCSFHRAL